MDKVKFMARELRVEYPGARYHVLQDSGAERQKAAEAQAEGVVAAELRRRHWRKADLMRRAKGGPAKVVLAVRLRAETVMPVKWTAARWGMGTPGYVHQFLFRQRKAGQARPYRDRLSDDERPISAQLFLR